MGNELSSGRAVLGPTPLDRLLVEVGAMGPQKAVLYRPAQQTFEVVVREGVAGELPKAANDGDV